MHDGKAPLNATDVIADGHLAGMTWKSANDNLQTGGNGLDDDPDYQNWYDELDASGTEPTLAELRKSMGLHL